MKYIYSKSHSKMVDQQDIYLMQEKPKKILVLSTLEIKDGYPWNDLFDDKSIMHGKLRTKRKMEEENKKGIVE